MSARQVSPKPLLLPCSQRTNLATCLISDGCYIINGACTSTLPTASGVTTAGPGTTATTTTTTGGQTQSQTQTSQGGQPPPPVVIPGPSVTPGACAPMWWTACLDAHLLQHWNGSCHPRPSSTPSWVSFALLCVLCLHRRGHHPDCAGAPRPRPLVWTSRGAW